MPKAVIASAFFYRQSPAQAWPILSSIWLDLARPKPMPELGLIRFWGLTACKVFMVLSVAVARAANLYQP